MRRVLIASCVVALVACGSSDPLPVQELTLAPAKAEEHRVLRAVLEASSSMLPVADPRLTDFDEWLLTFDGRHHVRTGAICTVSLTRDGEELRHLEGAIDAAGCTASWDGLDSVGAFAATGPVDVSASLTGADGSNLASAAARVEVVRVGFADIQLSPAPEGQRVPLLYRAMDDVVEGFYLMGEELSPWRLASLDTDEGPRALPEPWDDLLSPPLDPSSGDGVQHGHRNLPTAWVAGADVVFGALMVAPAEPTLTELRVVAPAGTTLSGDAAFVGGSRVLATTDASPVPAVGRYDHELSWTFEALAADGTWRPLPGSVSTVHRLYGLVAEPVFEHEGVPHRAWVDVVDAVTAWVEGRTADADEVAARIVEGVYWELGLSYDRERGASFYTGYPDGWSGATFDLSRFQDRLDGSIINCSDAASIVSTYSNMVGIDLRYHILRHQTDRRFDLNYIQAIGWEGFTSAPFFSGRSAFSYHAVVGPPDGRFFDATLALDGDGVPAAAPFTLLLVQGLAPDDYLRALSSEWTQVRTDVDMKVRIR